MNFLSELINSIKGRKKLYLIVFLQLTITFFTTIFAAAKIGYITDYKKAVSFINEDWVRPGVLNPANQQSLPSKAKQVKGWYDYVTSLDEVKNVGNISNNGIPLDGTLPGAPDYLKHLTTLCSIDKMFLNKFSDNIQDGRALNVDDYADPENKPVLISADLKHKYGYSVGTIIKTENLGSYKVIGILKPNVFIPQSGEIYNYTAINENFMILPLHYMDDSKENQEIKNAFDYMKYYQDVYIELKDIDKFDAFKEKADKEAERLNLSIRIISPSSVIETRVKNDLEFYSSELCITFIIIILAVLGIVAVYLSLVLRKKREFGIKLAMGASIRRLCLMLFAEVSLLISSSLAATSLTIYILHQLTKDIEGHVVYLESTGSTTIGIILITALIILLSVSIVPILKIRKFQPSELIKDV